MQVGKEVTFVLGYKTTTDREYGAVHLGSSTAGENMAESLVSEGLVTVRDGRADDNAKLKVPALLHTIHNTDSPRDPSVQRSLTRGGMKQGREPSQKRTLDEGEEEE